MDAFGSAQEIPWEWFVENEVAQEEFPLDFEGVVVGLLIGDFGPAFKEIDGLRLPINFFFRLIRHCNEVGLPVKAGKTAYPVTSQFFV